jgi:hypothetical protein
VIRQRKSLTQGPRKRGFSGSADTDHDDAPHARRIRGQPAVRAPAGGGSHRAHGRVGLRQMAVRTARGHGCQAGRADSKPRKVMLRRFVAVLTAECMVAVFATMSRNQTEISRTLWRLP